VTRLVPGLLRAVLVTAAVGLAVLCVAGGHLSASSARTAVFEPSGVTAAKTTADTVATTRTHGSVPKLIWGPVTFPNGRSAFPTYHRLGVDVFQIDLNWAETTPSRPADPDNPSDPSYQWPAQLSQAIAQAARYRIKICLLVQGTPGWANGGRATDWAPDQTSDYANFLTAAARRYPSVHLWMIWGEPNRAGNFNPMPANSKVGPRRYALLLDAGYHALKGVSKANIVIGGNTWSFGTVEPADFVKWMRLPDGKPPPLDYYGHNPFSGRFPALSEKPYYPGGRDINDIDTLDSQLDRVYHRPVKLWLSEFTVSSNHANRAFSFAVSRPEQAAWLTAAFRLADSVNYVAGMGWFNLVDQGALPHHRNLTTGLLTSRLKPKPAYYAYRSAP
jgi:hypothetical protein